MTAPFKAELIMFVKDAFKFIIRNKRLILTALFPALPLGFFVSPSAMIPFIFSYSPKADAPLTMMRALDSLFPMQNALWLFLIIPVLFVFCAAMFGLSEHKMRVGNYGFRGFSQRMNFGTTALLVPFLLACAFYVIWLLFSACVIVFAEFICFKLIGSAALSKVVVIVFSVMLSILLIMIMSLLLLWTPVTLVSGYGVMDSWYYQLKLLTGKVSRFALAIMVAFFINGALVTTCGLFLGFWAMAAINTVCFTFTIIYLIGLAMTAYFRLSGTPRKDVKEKYYK